ncbi:MAG: SDR family oxidoreductase [Acidobacteriota bacterium]|nr:SDR family oxidoreductase [Acidobacteriota bacterium]
MNFQNKVAIITGGGTGIGKETARQLLQLGGRVVLNGRREEILRQTAEALDPSGENVAFLAGSIALPETGKGLVELAKSRFGRVDILVNNAGIFKPTPFLDHGVEDFQSYVDIILKGTFFASQAAVAAMKEGNGGAIVNVGSMWAEQAIGATPSSAYSAAKAGVHALTRNLAIEHAADGIRVNAVAPAVVETPVYNTFMSDDEVAETLPGFNAFHPIGRNGQPRDVADAVLYLSGAE